MSNSVSLFSALKTRRFNKLLSKSEAFTGYRDLSVLAQGGQPI